MKRARPARSGWSRTSAQRPVAAKTAGADSPWTSACSTPTTPPGRSSSGGPALEHPDRVEAVGAGEEREVRVVVAGLGGDRLPGLERDVRRVAGDHVDGAGQVVEGRRPCRRGAGRRRCRRGCAPPRRAPARPARRRARAPSGPRRRPPWRSRRSRCTGRRRPGAASARRLLDRPAGEQLGLGPGHEDARARRRARRGGSTPCRSGAAAARGPRGGRAARRTPRAPRRARRRPAAAATAVGAEDVREQLGGVVLRAGDAGRAQPRRPPSASTARRGGHCSSASSRAARSASTQESSTGWRSPSSTWSRL